MLMFMLGKSKTTRKKPASSRRPRLHVAQYLGPPMTSEELRANLSELEKDLNARMKCHAGRNQVFIYSLVTPSGTTPPRICLKCHLRKDVGQKPGIFYEQIRDVCCGEPEQCEAYMAFRDRFVPT